MKKENDETASAVTNLPSKYKEWPWSLLFALCIALIFRSFVFQTFVIPSPSMVPTLLVGDYLFASKYIYGYNKFSFPSPSGVTDGKTYVPLVPIDKRFGFGRLPTRGEVAIFRGPRNPNTDYVKRVVGLPGDRIQMKEGILHINYEPVKIRRAGQYRMVPEHGQPYMVEQYIETLPNGVTHPILKHDAFGASRYDNTPVFVVPEKHYFMMGDNRDQSDDSRNPNFIGIVPEMNLVGRVEMLWFSIENSSILCLWDWVNKGRFGRIFSKVV